LIEYSRISATFAWVSAKTQHGELVALGGGQVEVIEILADQDTSLFAGSIVSEAQHDAAILLRQAAVADALFAQQGLDLAFVDFHAGVHGLVHVHFQQEVHTTGQVQAQLHRACAQVAQPLRGSLGQVQGHDVIIAQCLAHYILGW
jgi:hypothetical protein